jgi:hypothetical protein
MRTCEPVYFDKTTGRGRHKPLVTSDNENESSQFSDER